MTNEQEEYTTLFCEGDGSAHVDAYERPRVVFAQKERDVLDYIASQQQEKGVFYQNKQNVWTLTYYGSHCIPLLTIFSKHVVSTHFLGRLNKVLETVGLPLATQHPITLDGFVGFWDAEGSSDNHPALSITQKDKEVLDIMQQTFGGNVYQTGNDRYRWHMWSLYGKEARLLVPEILSRSHCPAKAERLRLNFEGPTYNELHHDKKLAAVRAYDTSHREKKRSYMKAYRAQQKLVREYLREHPEVVERYEKQTV